ncbi:MAG: pantetheine-phosphate adenylyltransferase [Fibrobacteres bacterium]|nr:pantetheine-phosphate adenylyltransferase [Fibrobacterota bacterium]
MPTAVYPGTFDPPTHGHLDLVERATRIFPKVLVVVAHNSRKTPIFTSEERVSLFQQALEERGIQGVEVHAWEGLTVDFCRNHGAKVMVRGLRQSGDFDSEQSIALLNHRLYPEVDTVFLPAREEHLVLSSTLVRELSRYQVDTSPFVPPVVVQALRQRFQGDA